MAVRKSSDVEEVRALVREYAASLPFALDFQDFDRELNELPGDYAPPRGALLLARGAGCVGLRPIDGTTWQQVYTTTTGNGGEDVVRFGAVAARYVRVTGTVRATSYGYSLYELQVLRQ